LDQLNQPAPPSKWQLEQDRWQREMLRACGLAIGHWLEKRGALSKPIRTLELFELEGMAADVIGTYNELREKRRKELNLKFREDGDYDFLGSA
jgi:hypothetical protein